MNLHDDADDEDACNARNESNTADMLTLAQKLHGVTYFDPLVPLPILVWLMGLFEFFDLVLTLQAQEGCDSAIGRRYAIRMLPLRLIRYVGILLCFGLLILSGEYILPLQQLPPFSDPPGSRKAKSKQKKCKHRQKPAPDPYCSMFGTTTSVRLPATQMRALFLNTVGDGNCMWRAIAKPNNMKWYVLKRKVIHYIASHKDPEHAHDLRRISKRNAWGNYFALTAAASFLQKDIRVFTTQAIINISIAGSKGSIDLALCNYHYSLMRSRSANQLISQCTTQFPRTMHDYLQQQDNLPHCIAHQQVYAQKNCSTKNCKYTKSEPSRAKTLQKQFATMVAASKLPAYRPAGTPSGQRRPYETFHDQVHRVAKAKTAAKGGYVGAVSGAAAPKTPPKGPGGRLVPTPPVGPPPAHLRVPPEPKGPPVKPIIRPAAPRAPQLGREMTTIPKAKPMPRAPVPRPSSPPDLPRAVASDSSSSSTELPKPIVSPVIPQPKVAGPPSFRLQELLIVSRGTKPECVQVNCKPPELQDPAWDIILKSLHRVDNPQRDKSLQGHIGINRRMILQLLNYEPMQTAVLSAAVQALRSQKAAVIFECSQGRHRSVGAAGILYQLLQPLIPKMKLVHASSRNWRSTCQGQCRECKQGPCPQFHLEIDRLRQVLLTQIEREYIEHCALALNYNKHVFLFKNPVGQVRGFGCQANQQHLGSFVFPFPTQLIRTLIEMGFGLWTPQMVVSSFRVGLLSSVDCKGYLSGGIIFQAAEDCINSALALDARNCCLQKPQHSKNPPQNYHRIVCRQNVPQKLPKFLQPETQIISPCVHTCLMQPRMCGGDDLPHCLLGRQVSGRPLHHSALGFLKFGCILIVSILWLILIGNVIHMQVAPVSAVCKQSIASPAAQSKLLCLDLNNAMRYDLLYLAHTLSSSKALLDDTAHELKNCSNETSQCAKTYNTRKVPNPRSLTMVAASKLPEYRPAGTRSGQRRPNESFEEQTRRVTKAKATASSSGGGLHNRDATTSTMAPKTPPKHLAKNAPTTLPKAVSGGLVPMPPPGPPPHYVKAPPTAKAMPKAKISIRPAVPRPPPAQKSGATSSAPPLVAPKDAALTGGYHLTCFPFPC